MIVIIDFGSQTAQLIERRVRQFSVATLFVPPSKALAAIKKNNVTGIILSGGPASVYEKGAPTIDSEIFTQKIPVLAICYGMQLMMRSLGGEVIGGRKEYGPSEFQIARRRDPILNEMPIKMTVWMSHGDEVVKLPKGFETLGSTRTVPYAFVKRDNLYGMLFHPEVEHTENGTQLLKNFIALCNSPKVDLKIDVDEMVKKIREEVGNAYVIGAVSGGVDSTVAGALTAKAIGKQFLPIYVNNGLMREGTTDMVKKIFTALGTSVEVLEVEDQMLKRLKGVKDPEKKRKIIGAYYIELFEQEMTRLIAIGKDVKYLLQGTIYSDVIESKGTKHASKIKSHHNVGGLPKNMKLRLIEPLRHLYKDEVRKLGSILGLSDEFVWQQVFPGPGYGVRIRGEVTKERLHKVRIADSIVLEEIKAAGLFRKVYMSFAIMSGAESTAVKGDGRFFGEVVALRVVESQDVMTSKWAHLPYEVLQKISSRIVNEVPEVSRVVYDITTKPPATMEWE